MSERVRYVISAAIPPVFASLLSWVIAPLVLGLDPAYGQENAMLWYPVAVGFVAGLFGNVRTAAVVGVSTALSVMIFGLDVDGIVPVALLSGLLTGALTWAVSVLVSATGRVFRRARG